MVKKYKAVKLTNAGLLTDEEDEVIICPIRKASCTTRCAWFSFENRVFRCKDTIIGALKADSMRSFRLHKGPDIYYVLPSENPEPYQTESLPEEL